MIPNVCMGWASKQAECKWCHQTIETASPEVMVFFWNKGSDGRRFNVKIYYHPQCWIEQGLDYLKMNPYRPKPGRGRPKVVVAESVRKERRRLLMKKAALEQRKLRLKTPYPDRLLKEVQIDEQIAGVMLEIAEVGGIPRSWLEKVMR